MGDHLDDLTPSWERSMRARNLAKRTIESYTETLDQFARWSNDNNHPTTIDAIGRTDIEDWIISLLDTRSTATARLRYASLQQFFRWAVIEGELEHSPMADMRPPAQGEKLVDVVSDTEFTAITDTITGTDFAARRDTAILWTLFTTGIRADELVGMTCDAVDLDVGTITVIGKGDRERSVGIGDQAVAALDRYQRVRRRHRDHRQPDYWLGRNGPLTDSGLRQLVRKRGDAAGVPKLHPHRFRHTFAHRWLSKGGTEGGLQTAAGWRSPQMLQRYGASAKAERSRAEAARLDLEALG